MTEYAIVDWTERLPWHPTKRWAIRNLQQITHFIVHHSATGENPNPELTIQAFNRGHIRRGWARIAYHYVITIEGKIYQTNKNLHITSHSGNSTVNKTSIGVCLIGELHKYDPTKAQLDALKWLRKRSALPAKAHYEIVGTSCPGRRWWQEWKDWLNDGGTPIGPTTRCLLTLHNQLGIPGWLPWFIRETGVTWMKTMDPGDAEPLPEFQNLNWIIRFYEPENVARNEVLFGAAGAHQRLNRVKHELRKRPWLAEDRYWLEHMNEPSNALLLQTQQKRQMLDLFTAEYTRVLFEEFGIRSCGYNLGVGHPEPEHVRDIFSAGLPMLKRYDGIWSLHEYGWPYVLQRDSETGVLKEHWTLRHRPTIKAISNTLRWQERDLPPLHLTEAGIDRLLTGIVGGWKMVDNNPQHYANQLAVYDKECRKTPLVQGIYLYTATPEQTWWSYGIEEADAQHIAKYISSINKRG